jgi:hypothetical protein
MAVILGIKNLRDTARWADGLSDGTQMARQPVILTLVRHGCGQQRPTSVGFSNAFGVIRWQL